MPVVEVVPSLIAGQAYEARAWLEPHSRSPEQVPVRVRWSAGEKFATLVCYPDGADDRFCVSFHYYGPVAVQAVLEFADGHEATGYVYARMKAGSEARLPTRNGES